MGISYERFLHDKLKPFSNTTATRDSMRFAKQQNTVPDMLLVGHYGDFTFTFLAEDSGLIEVSLSHSGQRIWLAPVAQIFFDMLEIDVEALPPPFHTQHLSIYTIRKPKKVH